MNKSKLKKIKEIEKQVPQALRDKLMKEEYVAPDLREEAIKTLSEYPEEIDSLSGDEKSQAIKECKRLQNLFDAGYFDAKEMVVDPTVAKQIDDYVEKGIKAAIKSGDLPPAKNDKELEDYVKKLQRNEKRKQSNLRTK